MVFGEWSLNLHFKQPNCVLRLMLIKKKNKKSYLHLCDNFDSYNTGTFPSRPHTSAGPLLGKFKSLFDHAEAFHPDPYHFCES